MKFKFDWRWLILGGILVISLIIAIVVNLSTVDNSTDKITNTVDVDNGDLKINWERYQTTDIVLSESLTISESGTYHLSGTLDDGNIVIEAGTGEVRLILDNVQIKNSFGPAILCSSAEDLVVELVGENSLEDGSNYSGDLDADITGVIYSKADLSFGGEGVLSITANYQDGIVGKDDVKFNSGNYSISAQDDAIRGKDSVYIVNGTFSLNSTADAIKSTNETDFGKGFVMVENGTLNIHSSGKGVKATRTILIYGGQFNIDSYDDAIHSNSYVGIVGGEINVTSGDDGVHADRELIIDSGTVNITKSYEGLEAQVITVNGGMISIIASDDGINAGGGSDASATNRPGAGAFAADENCTLSINGGEVYINSSGDGADSNGQLFFNGGKVIIDGPTNNGNGALDSGLGISMSGGEVIAVGSSGMAETLGSSSGVFNLSVYFSAVQAAGTKITIQDSAGNTVLEHLSAKSFSHLAAGSDWLNPGETYIIYLNDQEYARFSISEVTTVVGNQNVNQHNLPQSSSTKK